MLCSWLVGYGKDYPNLVWHKYSDKNVVTYPQRGKTIFSGLSIPQTDGTLKKLWTCEAGKLDFEGAVYRVLSPRLQISRTVGDAGI